tara:strand:+ start:71007 stop:72194 length:1188 start_codon:yes stop_codon:yes gene_type:complete
MMKFPYPLLPAIALGATVALNGSIATAAIAATALPQVPSPALPHEQTVGDIEQVFAFDGPMPTGVTVADNGRIFVNFPRWGDDVPFTVAELRDGKAVPYPDIKINTPKGQPAAEAFISVQSVVMDSQNRLWVLDTAAPGFSAPQPGGAKLVAIDLDSNKVVKTIVFPKDVILDSTYLNDVRFDLSQGKAGTAYVTDSSMKGPGAIIVLDIASGKALRRLSGADSTSPDPDFVPVVEGRRLMNRAPDGTTSAFAVAADGIALPADGKDLYFSPLAGRHLYSVPTAMLRDESIPDSKLIEAVKDLGEKGASDGLESDATGAVYATDYEHNAIHKRHADGSWTTIANDPRILWPDTLSVAADGYLYFTANQLHRQPGFHGGKDLRKKPYSLFRVKLKK